VQRFHEGDARIFAATTAIGPALIIGLRLQRDPEPLDAGRIASFIKSHSRNASARIIPSRDRPGHEVGLLAVEWGALARELLAGALAARPQVIVTVTQIENIYWDLVNAFSAKEYTSTITESGNWRLIQYSLH
jgi:hypothetical protein